MDRVNQIMRIFVCIFISVAICSCGQQHSKREIKDGRLPVVDKGVWVKINEGEIVEGYRKIEGELYWGYYDPDECISLFPAKIEDVDIDMESFRICKGSDYAKDKNRIYYPSRQIAADGEDFGATYAEKHVLEGADVKTFKYIGNGYAVDRHHMYSDGFIIPWDNEVIRSNGENYTGKP